MKLISKLIVLGIVLLSSTVLVSVMGVFYMEAIGDDVKQIAHDDLPAMRSLSKITVTQMEQSVWLERAISAAQIDDKEKFDIAAFEFERTTEDVVNEMQAVSADISYLIKNSNDVDVATGYQELHESLLEIDSYYDEYLGISSQFFTLLQNDDVMEAEELVEEMQEILTEVIESLQVLNMDIGTKTEDRVIRVEMLKTSGLWVFLMVSLVAIVLALFIGYWLLCSIMNQLGGDPSELELIAKRVASGNLRLEKDNKVGVYGAINTTVEKLVDVIKGIMDGSYEVTAASIQVLQGNENLSQRTQEQASSIEEISSSMEEMTSTVNRNSDNAQLASELANEAKNQAKYGGEVASETVNAMKEIRDSSNKMADIISVIDEIAFQTNLLALNAAVEAARAGEQGRGFAVVASEVRNLASRSATAAKEVKGLISDSRARVEQGTLQAGKSGAALEEIVGSVDKVNNIVAEIAMASKEQSAGIEQVNTALIQMDAMTQQNASLVEEASATSEAMGAQAEELTALVSYFTIEGSHATNTRTFGEIKTGENDIEVTKIESPVQQRGTKNLLDKSVKETEGSEWRDF